MFACDKQIRDVPAPYGKTYSSYSKNGDKLPCESTKYSVVKEFQCFFVLRDGELKSWLITCICSWL